MIRRRTAVVVSALSSLLALMVLTTWITSLWYSIGLSHDYSHQTGPDVTDTGWSVFAGPHNISVMRSTYVHPDTTLGEVLAATPSDEKPYFVCRSSAVVDHADPVISNGILDWRFHTVGIYQFTHGASDMSVAELPYFAPFLLFAVGPAVAVRRWRTRRRAAAAGRCVRCGYDLRATPTTCPECGTAASIPTASR